MKRLLKIWPVALIAIVFLNMPSIKGLSGIQLDRSIHVEFSPPGEGEFTVLDLNEGPAGAVHLPHKERYLGKIINNYNFALEVEFEMEVEFLEAVYEGTRARWDNIIISVGAHEMNFNKLFSNDSPEKGSAGFITLQPGEELEVSIDQKSDVVVIGQPPRILHYFLGVARFYITGYSLEGEPIFYMEPSGDFLQQYFVKGEQNTNASTAGLILQNDTFAPVENWTDGHENTAFPDSLYPVQELYLSNLKGQIEYLQHNPESADAFCCWYEAADKADNTILYVRFEDPLLGLSGTQALKLLLRRTGNGERIPELDLDLYQDGRYVTSLTAKQNVECALGQVFTYSFEAEELFDLSGSALEAWLFGNKSGGFAQDVNTVEFGAIMWVPQYQ